jgi:hypothetical protein
MRSASLPLVVVMATAPLSLALQLPSLHRHLYSQHCNGGGCVAKPRLLRLRGGLMVATTPDLAASAASATGHAATAIVKSFNSEGIAFFTQLRTPAALLAAAAMKDAWALAGTMPDDIRTSRSWTFLRDAHLYLQLLTFNSAMTTIFIATHAIVSLQMGMGVSERCHASSLVVMMKTNFAFEYVTVRASFMTGLLAFTVAQALRARFVLRQAKELSWAAMYFMLCTVSLLFAYNNSKSITYGGYLGLVREWARLTREMLLSRATLHHPMPLVFGCSFALGVLCTLRVLFRTLFEQLDSDQDGKISFKEASDFVAELPRRLWRSAAGQSWPSQGI